MDSTRRRELRASLVRQLTDESAQSRFSPRDRVHWLGDQVEEYLERWLAFCAASDPVSPLFVESALFDMLEIGSEVLTEELHTVSTPSNVADAWHGFEAALKRIRHQGDWQQAQRLRKILAEWRSLASSVG